MNFNLVLLDNFSFLRQPPYPSNRIHNMKAEALGQCWFKFLLSTGKPLGIGVSSLRSILRGYLEPILDNSQSMAIIARFACPYSLNTNDLF